MSEREASQDDSNKMSEVLNSTIRDADKISRGATAFDGPHSETVQKLILFLRHLVPETEAYATCQKRLDVLTSLHPGKRNRRR